MYLMTDLYRRQCRCTTSETASWWDSRCEALPTNQFNPTQLEYYIREFWRRMVEQVHLSGTQNNKLRTDLTWTSCRLQSKMRSILWLQTMHALNMPQQSERNFGMIHLRLHSKMDKQVCSPFYPFGQNTVMIIASYSPTCSSDSSGYSW